MHTLPKIYRIIPVSVILWLLTSVLVWAQEEKYVTRFYTIEDGLSHNSVLDITKDRNGFIWTTAFLGVSNPFGLGCMVCW